jgi:hypothetical protein
LKECTAIIFKIEGGGAIHPIKIRAVHAIKTSGTDNPASEHNNPKDVGNIRFTKFTKTVFRWLAIIFKFWKY